MISLPVYTWLRFVVWMVLGLIIYFLYSMRSSRLARGEGVEEAAREA
jgi:APA family basic amino acid/polyamine antiporter